MTNDICFGYTFAMAKADSQRNIAAYRTKKFEKSRRYAVMVFCFAFLLWPLLSKRKKAVSVLIAVGMSALTGESVMA